MNFRFNSIKSRIILLYVAIIGVVLGILAVFFIFYLKSIVYKPIDMSLKKKAMQLDKLIRSTTIRFSFSNAYGRRFEIDLSKAQLWIYSSVYSKYYFQLRTVDGKLIEKSTSLGNLMLPFTKNMNKFETVKVGNKFVRLFNFKDKSDKMIIQVAYNVKNERDMLLRFEILIFLTLLFILIISAASGFYVSHRALGPLEDLTKQIRGITEHNLDRKVYIRNVPDELKDVIDAFNSLMERLSDAFKREKQFISDVSHELKTPISVIQMQCDLALRKERSSENYKKALRLIKETISKMVMMVDKMLMLSRLEALNHKFSESVSLKGTVLSAIRLLRHKAEDRKVDINLEVEDDCLIEGDRNLLEELFVNLIDNAIKYNVENGKVLVKVTSLNGECEIAIKDTGVGIEEVELDKVFEGFYRVDKSRSKTTEGFGLGLSIVKKIVDLHKGKVFIESIPSKGTTVFVRFKKSVL